MSKNNNLTTVRANLDTICKVPEKIISVYSLEKHVWAEGNSDKAIKNRKPEIQTIDEFQIDPVRHFLNDVFRNMSAPYKSEKKDNPIGQGYWIQAEFGSGKSHLLCLLASLALGSQESWELIRQKEHKAGRGKRESLARFWDEGLQAKSTGDKKGIFVVVKTLVGSGGGTVGYDEAGRRLSEYIIDAVKEQIHKELSKNISLYPVELLANRFIKKDLERYRNELKKFLRDPAYFEDDEFEDIDVFIQSIQNISLEDKKDCGNKLWRFYDEYLGVRPNIEYETEDVLRNMVQTILAEGYSGILILLDEVSLFMKDRPEKLRIDDEKTLVVLSNRLAKVENFPIWTVCAAQQSIESKTPGSKNIIADDRLKLVPLLQEDNDYYNIVLSRVREITNQDAISGYYNFYRRGFTWPNDIGEDEFKRFFPFHKPAIEVLRDITHELTTARSAIHFMHQTLKHAIKFKKNELIRLFDFFDEAIEYEEDPSGTNAGLVAIKTKRDQDYKIYESCKQYIDSVPKGFLKVYHDRSLKSLQTLFLYYIARRKFNGLTGEELANNILIEKSPDALVQENIEHYDVIADNLRKELRQINESKDEDNKSRFRFDPVVTGIDPREEFEKSRGEAESNENMQIDAWNHLLALDEWLLKTNKMTYDLSHGIKSIFSDIVPNTILFQDTGPNKKGDQKIGILWQNRQTEGLIGMRELGRIASENKPLPAIESPETDDDFAVFIGTRPVDYTLIEKLLLQRQDPRLILWTPGEMTQEERDRLITFAAYRKLIQAWQGKESEDAITIVNWVYDQLQTEMGRIEKIVTESYGRGRMDALNNSQMPFNIAGELETILTPIVNRVLSSTYESSDVSFEGNISFGNEDAVKLINGIVRKGSIPKGTKIGKDESAAQNFGKGLMIINKSNWRELDISENRYSSAIWDFIEEKLTDTNKTMPVSVLYKNFMGINGPDGKNYGLNRRMVQIYLLSLARFGKIRINMSKKSQISQQSIDYSTIADIDFSTRILESMLDIQKMEKPENWDVFRPYAEKILGKTISDTSDDLRISEIRGEILTRFKEEKMKAQKIIDKSKNLFEIIEIQNPYEKEMNQIASLFSHDISGGDDIKMALYALKKAMGYQAFDTEVSDPTEIDDLAVKLNNYQNLQKFVEYESNLEAIHRYCKYSFPETKELSRVHEIIKEVNIKLENVRPFIDSEIKMRTEFIGEETETPTASGTLRSLITEYTKLYLAMHNYVLSKLEASQKDLDFIISSEEMKVFDALEGVSALQHKGSTEVRSVVNECAAELFICANPSHASVERDLRSRPEHECNLSFATSQDELQKANDLVIKAKETFDIAFNKSIEFFLNSAIRERLKQGQGEKVIDGIIACTTVEELKDYFTKTYQKNPEFVNIINRYLKKIIIRRIRIADFHPSSNTVEKDQIKNIVKEFEEYLEKELNSVEATEDTLPILQME